MSNIVGLRVKTPNGDSNGLLYRPRYVIFAGAYKGTTIEVEVLADEAAPTPSGGYAKWARIKRRQRKSLTVLEGYEPFELEVPVLFDAVRTNGIQEDVENKIQWLEWMGGRGIKATHGFEAGVGKAALLQVYTASSASQSTQLVPRPFQTPNLLWFVDDIVWDPNPLRDVGGARIRQKATVKLVEYVIDAPPTSEPAGGGATTHYTTKSLNTVRKLVAHFLVGSRSRLGEAVSATIALNKGNRRIGTHPEKPLAVHTAVRIPNKYLNTV